MNKNKINLIIIPLVVLILYFSYIYYSNKHFGFNAEFIVFLCFTVFVTLSYKTVRELFNDSMDSRSNEIANQYKQLRSVTISTYEEIINKLNRYNSIPTTILSIFYFFVQKIQAQYNSYTINNVSTFIHSIKKDLSNLLYINSLYESYSKYYFIKSLALELEKEENMRNQLTCFLNNVNYLKNSSSHSYKNKPVLIIRSS